MNKSKFPSVWLLPRVIHSTWSEIWPCPLILPNREHERIDHEGREIHVPCERDCLRLTATCIFMFHEQLSTNYCTIIIRRKSMSRRISSKVILLIKLKKWYHLTQAAMNLTRLSLSDSMFSSNWEGNPFTIWIISYFKDNKQNMNIARIQRLGEETFRLDAWVTHLCDCKQSLLRNGHSTLEESLSEGLREIVRTTELFHWVMVLR